MKMKWIQLGVGGGALMVLGFTGYFYVFSKTPYRDPVRVGSQSETEKVDYELKKGSKPMEIAQGLQDKGLVSDSFSFYWLGRLTGRWSKVKSADYEILVGQTPLQIFKTLESGIGKQKSILLREGENIYLLSARMADLGFLNQEEVFELFFQTDFLERINKKYRLNPDGTLQSLEGYLHPNTYFYDKKEKAQSVIEKMVQGFAAIWTPELDRRALELGLTKHQVVTLASMIEKETGAAFERKTISSVFHNRLKKKMRLQSDPTTIYGLGPYFSGNLKRADLLRPTPYNTYTIPALPIGPICNPHFDSIQAALYPDETEFYYFVSRNDGTHVFSKTYEEHSMWVKKLQLDPKAREGKSWRDLNQ